MSQVVKKKRVLLEPGVLIPSESSRYVIAEVLGSGGFGDVYKVVKECGDPNEIFALKTEENNIEDRLRRLKMEAEVLAECAKAKRTHFIGLVDRGRTEDFKFIVMPVVGPTLDKVRSQLSNKQFTKNTGHRVCVQLLESLRDLHRMGYLHRDLKPSNFAVGLDDRQTIFMLDFGIARKFLDKEGKIVIPRCKVAFMGTPRYAPRVAHRLQEQARKDDLESLVFVMTDIFSENCLPWRGQRDKIIVLQLKENFMLERGPIVNEIFNKLPRELLRCVRYVEKLSYELNPSYDFLINEMKGPIKFNNDPLDWIDPNAPANALPLIPRTMAYATRIVEPDMVNVMSAEPVRLLEEEDVNPKRSPPRKSILEAAKTQKTRTKSSQSRSRSREPTGKPVMSMEELREMTGSRAAALLKTLPRKSPAKSPDPRRSPDGAKPQGKKSPDRADRD